MLRILHAADLHLDAPFAALDGDSAALRRREQRLLPDKLADVAIERHADLVLLAGDLLDSAQTYRETAQALAAALGRIPAPVVIAPGNHDFYSPSSLYAASFWSDNVHIFRTESVERLELPNVTVYGSAFTSTYRHSSPLQGFHHTDDGKPAVMVLHGDVESPSDRYCPISRREIADSGLRYLALGHVHACSGLRREGETCWAYSGCTEGRGFDELGSKGGLWVTLEDDGSVTAELLPLCERKYEILDCDLTGKAPAAAIIETLERGDPKNICRLILSGEADTLDLPALTELARPYRMSVSLVDHTRIPQNLWARESEDTLTGLFLRELRRRLDNTADDTERAALERAARFGLAALENGEDRL